MTKTKLQGGFLPILIVVIVAAIAIGGGAYVVSKNKAAKVDTSADVKADAKADAKLDAKAKGSLSSLLKLGKNVMCKFSSTAGGNNSSGTMYIAANGDTRGDFKMVTSGGSVTSSMIMKGGVWYGWSGSQGVKMAVPENAGVDNAAAAQAEKYVDLNAEVDYSCSDWSVDGSKFTLPAGVNFIDVKAMLEGAAGPGSIDIKSLIKYEN